MKKGNFIVIIIVGIITILITSFVMIGVLYYTKSNHLSIGTSDGWLGFYGSFVGSVIALIGGIGVTIWQIKDEKEYQANILREERNFEKLKKLDDELGNYLIELSQIEVNFNIYYLEIINKLSMQSTDVNKLLELSVDNYDSVCKLLNKLNKEVFANVTLRNIVTNTLSDDKKYDYEFADAAAAVWELQTLLIKNPKGWQSPRFIVKEHIVYMPHVLGASIDYIRRLLNIFLSDTKSALLEQRTDIKSKIDK